MGRIVHFLVQQKGSRCRRERECEAFLCFRTAPYSAFAFSFGGSFLFFVNSFLFPLLLCLTVYLSIEGMNGRVRDERPDHAAETNNKKKLVQRWLKRFSILSAAETRAVCLCISLVCTFPCTLLCVAGWRWDFLAHRARPRGWKKKLQQRRGLVSAASEVHFLSASCWEPVNRRDSNGKSISSRPCISVIGGRESFSLPPPDSQHHPAAHRHLPSHRVARVQVQRAECSAYSEHSIAHCRCVNIDALANSYRLAAP